MRNKAHGLDGCCRFPVGFVVFEKRLFSIIRHSWGLANESSEVQIIIINASAAGFSGLSCAPLGMTIGLVFAPCVKSRAWSEYELTGRRQKSNITISISY